MVLVGPLLGSPTLEKLAEINGDLNGSITQQIAQATFAQAQRDAQMQVKQFGDLTTFAQETHASVATMTELINKQAVYDQQHPAALGMTPLEIFNQAFQAKQQLLNQQFSTAPINFGSNLQSQEVQGSAGPWPSLA